MCVIIYVPKEANIDDDEIRSAWQTNPDGAGYSIQKNNKVFFKRGFMDYQEYLKEIRPLIGVYNIVLHFRISTSQKINELQTHPYKKGNIEILSGETDKPVIYMNGVIPGQATYAKYNDTMSYIKDHEKAFGVINDDIINIIEKATGAKWAVMTPNDVFLSSQFIENEGKFYSNQNHLWKNIYNYNNINNDLVGYIKNSKLRRKIRKNTFLYYDVLDYINDFCKNGTSCWICKQCLKDCKNIKEVKETLDQNYFCVENGMF